MRDKFPGSALCKSQLKELNCPLRRGGVGDLPDIFSLGPPHADRQVQRRALSKLVTTKRLRATSSFNQRSARPRGVIKRGGAIAPLPRPLFSSATSIRFHLKQTSVVAWSNELPACGY